jgi:hypothetical protein
VIDIAPDGGPQAALFPDLNMADWTRDILEDVAADGDVPAHRYERLTRKAAVRV